MKRVIVACTLFAVLVFSAIALANDWALTVLSVGTPYTLNDTFYHIADGIYEGDYWYTWTVTAQANSNSSITFQSSAVSNLYDGIQGFQPGFGILYVIDTQAGTSTPYNNWYCQTLYSGQTMTMTINKTVGADPNGGGYDPQLELWTYENLCPSWAAALGLPSGPHYDIWTFDAN